MADAETTAPKQRGIPFKPGQSGNPAGRPKGSRNKLAEDFVRDLHDDWQTGGKAAICKVREERPHEYLKVVASILPKELKIERSDELSDDELDTRIRTLAALIGVEIRAGESAGREETPLRH